MNVKSWITAKLKDDAAFISAIGTAEHLVYFYPNSFSIMPIVAYSEAGHRQTSYQDDVSKAIESVLVFDIYAKESTSTIFEALISVMSANYFNLDFSTDLFEPDTKLFHKNCRFSRALRATDLV